MRRSLFQAGAGLSVLAVLGLLSSEASAVQVPSVTTAEVSVGRSAEPVTYTRDVAPIIQQNCQVCHRPGSIAPMALLSYEDARRWAPLIKSRVQDRIMPPWHIDKTVGIQEFKNDISLTDQQIGTIVRWVDEGTPLGDLAELPPPVEWPAFEASWKFEEVFGRPPDLVIKSTPYTVVANAMDQWPSLVTPVEGLASPRWIRAVEVKPSDPGSRYVFHHGNASLVQGGQRRGLVASAAGKDGDRYPEDSGKLIEPGSSVRFGMHFHPMDHDIEAVMELGLWFYDLGEQPELVTEGEQLFRADAGYQVRANDLLIPPHGTAMLQGVHVLEQPARIHSVRAHMHLRGKYQMLEALYPDGRREILSKINFQHTWHTTHLYADHVQPLLPKGTMLITTSWFDNTADNPYNPDPDQWVTFGKRTVDDMSHLWVGITYLDEESFQRLSAERERARLRVAEVAQQ